MIKLEICLKCNNRIVAEKHYIDADGSMVREFYWYCLYDQTHNDTCECYEPIDNTPHEPPYFWY